MEPLLSLRVGQWGRLESKTSIRVLEGSTWGFMHFWPESWKVELQVQELFYSNALGSEDLYLRTARESMRLAPTAFVIGLNAATAVATSAGPALLTQRPHRSLNAFCAAGERTCNLCTRQS